MALTLVTSLQQKTRGLVEFSSTRRATTLSAAAAVQSSAMPMVMIQV